MTSAEQFVSKIFEQVAGRNICRTCLRKSSNMKHLDDSSIQNLYEICVIKLSPDDKALKMCVPCYYQLHRAAQFRKGCFITNRTLLQWAQKKNNSESVDGEILTDHPSSFSHSEMSRSSLLSIQCLDNIQRCNGKPEFKIYTHCPSKTLLINEDPFLETINAGKSHLLSEANPTIKNEVLCIDYTPDNDEGSLKINESQRTVPNSNNDESCKTNNRSPSNNSKANDDNNSHKTNKRRRNNSKSNNDGSRKTNERRRNSLKSNNDDSHKTNERRLNNLKLNNDDSHKSNERRRNNLKSNNDDSHKTNERRRNNLKSNNDDSHKSNEQRRNNLNLNDDDSYKTNERRRNNFNLIDEDLFKSEKTQDGNVHEFINLSEVKMENDDSSDFSHHAESSYNVEESKVKVLKSKKRILKKELPLGGDVDEVGNRREENNCEETDDSDAEPLNAKVQRKTLKCEESQLADHVPEKRPRFRYRFEPSKVRLVKQTVEQQLEELARMRMADKYIAAPYRCDACAKYFVSETSLHQHNQRHEESFGAHVCPVCTLRYGGATSLSRHAQTHSERYACARCPAVFCAAKSVLSHAAGHDGERPTFVCTACGKISKSLGTHKRHEKLHTKERPYKCDRCPRDFTQSSARNYHIMRVHTKVHNYACPSCPSTFVTPTALQAHARRHSSERAHYCVECDLHFKSPSSLRSHLTLAVRHALPSALRFACEECGLRYTTRQRLLDHVHSNHERSFRHACPDCDKAYHTLGSLKKHRTSRHTPGSRQRAHKCGQCDKAFTTPTVLKIHLRTHSGEMPYSCSVCSRTFRHTSSLWNHNKLVHKKGATDPSKV